MNTTIAFIGAGQMARALAQGFVRAGLVEEEAVSAADPSSAARETFAEVLPKAWLTESNADAVRGADVIVLAVKPQHAAAAAAEMRPALEESKLVVSIVAGVTIATLAEQLGTSRVVRVMPNTPALVGACAAGFALGKGATADDALLVERLLSAVGVAFPVDERLLDAVTGLSGSGPAYAFVMIEALADGGVRMGLPRDVALSLAAQTLLGAATMVLETGEHPAILKDRVASPGGTTIAGLQTLEDRGLRGALSAAVEAAARRSAELGK
ncbi:MAG: pyrroline-5-carboxylate reductase [Planctomycetes bacterium]|nr:pyrroline-5-carboxylate reductase [Planctomycetota bacterium]